MKRYTAVLLAGLLVSCGGGGGDSTGVSGGGSGGPSAGVGARAEESDASVTLSGAWTAASSGWGWSGGTAVQSNAAGATASFSFSGSSVRWIGSRGRAMGIALVSVDGGPGREVDLFARPDDEVHTPIITISDLSDGPHTLTITVTGRRNAAATGARIVVDAFDIMTPGRRYEEYDSSLSFVGTWDPHRDSRVFSEGASATSNQTGATATFRFTGTSVTWIGCQKGSASGRARVTLDGVVQGEFYMGQSYPIEGYQMPVFRRDGLANGPHTLTIEVINTDGAYVVVDAFDVR